MWILIETKICSKCGEEKPNTTEYFRFDVIMKKICRDCERKRHREWWQENKEKQKEVTDKYQKEYRVKNRELLIEKSTNYYNNNKDKVRKRLRIYEKEKTKNNPKFRVSKSMKSNIRQSLILGKEGRTWESLVGYTVNDLIKHLAKKFKDGMSWDNYGEWHIDHIIPISVFHYTSYHDLDFKRCWALSNLQPMWAKENISKHAKITKPFQPALAIAV